MSLCLLIVSKTRHQVSNGSKFWIDIATVPLCLAIVSKACHQAVKQFEVFYWIGIATVSLCFAIVSKACHQVVKQLNVLDMYCNCVVVPCHCIENTSPGGHTACIFG